MLASDAQHQIVNRQINSSLASALSAREGTARELIITLTGILKEKEPNLAKSAQQKRSNLLI